MCRILLSATRSGCQSSPFHKSSYRIRQFLHTASHRNMSQPPKILSTEDLPTSDAKWVSLKKIYWSDPDGKKRTWECAERRTRGSSGIDAVAILAILRSETNAFPPSTVIVEQFRPPVGKFVVELPAGLIDEGETAEQAAIRELQEETGFKAKKVLETSPLVVCDPGMTTANMKLVAVDVPFSDKLEESAQKLEPGEYITMRIVQLTTLAAELKEYENKGYVVDARLSHFASGYELAERMRSGNL